MKSSHFIAFGNLRSSRSTGPEKTEACAFLQAPTAYGRVWSTFPSNSQTTEI